MKLQLFIVSSGQGRRWDFLTGGEAVSSLIVSRGVGVGGVVELGGVPEA